MLVSQSVINIIIFSLSLLIQKDLEDSINASHIAVHCIEILLLFIEETFILLTIFCIIL